MDENNKKIVTVSFAIAALLVGFVVNVLLEIAAASFGFMARAMDVGWFSHGFPVLVGLLVFVVLQFNSKVLVWADEVVMEIRKVVWPSKKDTTAMTIVVCIMVVISGVILMVFDIFSEKVVKLIIN